MTRFGKNFVFCKIFRVTLVFIKILTLGVYYMFRGLVQPDVSKTCIKAKGRAVVVPQLVERSLPIPEVRGSNPVIGINLYVENLFIYCQLC